MVIIGVVEIGGVSGEPMDEYVVGGLDVEGLLDFGVWRDEKMEEYQGQKENGKKGEYCRN